MREEVLDKTSFVWTCQLIFSNSCWEEPTETQSTAALPVIVHCLPPASDRSEAFGFNLKVRLRDQSPRKFTESLPLLAHVSCVANNRLPVWHLRLLDSGIPLVISLWRGSTDRMNEEDCDMMMLDSKECDEVHWFLDLSSVWFTGLVRNRNHHLVILSM